MTVCLFRLFFLVTVALGTNLVCVYCQPIADQGVSIPVVENEPNPVRVNNSSNNIVQPEQPGQNIDSAQSNMNTTGQQVAPVQNQEVTDADIARADRFISGMFDFIEPEYEQTNDEEDATQQDFGQGSCVGSSVNIDEDVGAVSGGASTSTPSPPDQANGISLSSTIPPPEDQYDYSNYYYNYDNINGYYYYNPYYYYQFPQAANGYYSYPYSSSGQGYQSTTGPILTRPSCVPNCLNAPIGSLIAIPTTNFPYYYDDGYNYGG